MKNLILLSLFIFSTSAFSTLNDGIFRAESETFDKRNWKDFAVIEVKNGVIISSNYDAMNNKGMLKSEDYEYNQKYREICNIDIPEISDILQDQLIEYQDPAKIDSIAGATASTNNFKLLINSALEASQKNNQNISIIKFN